MDVDLFRHGHAALASVSRCSHNVAHDYHTISHTSCVAVFIINATYQGKSTGQGVIPSQSMACNDTQKTKCTTITHMTCCVTGAVFHETWLFILSRWSCIICSLCLKAPLQDCLNNPQHQTLAYILLCECYTCHYVMMHTKTGCYTDFLVYYNIVFELYDIR